MYDSSLPRSAGGVIAAVAAVLAAAWLVTWWTAADYGDLRRIQLAGVAPAGTVLLVALSAFVS